LAAGEELSDLQIDLHLSTLKPIHAKWVIKAWGALQEKPEAIKLGWMKAGIKDALDPALADESERIDVIID
jgi:hypothetical protein